MKTFFRRVAALLFVVALLAAGGLYAVRGRGVSALPVPSWVEERAALWMRAWLTPPEFASRPNPVAATPEALAEARQHFADHCATCHGNDGSGQTEVGRNLYPKAPDMRLARTQQLSDGELFYLIEYGVRLTGMPGWRTGTPEGEAASWSLVHFIRHLPALTPDELADMERHNPVSRAVFEEERRVEEFLSGADTPPPAPTGHEGHKP